VVILEGRSEYVLGREGQDQVIPEVNLNTYGAREKGVSRVHAALRRDHNQVLLIDLGSTNGTRLNAQCSLPRRISSPSTFTAWWPSGCGRSAGAVGAAEVDQQHLVVVRRSARVHPATRPSRAPVGVQVHFGDHLVLALAAQHVFRAAPPRSPLGVRR